MQFVLLLIITQVWTYSLMELNLAGDNTQSPLLTRLLEVKREVEEASDLGTDRVYMSQPNGDFRRIVNRG